MNILRYEDWMRPQVIQMFVQEYGVKFGEFEQLFIHFYESDFQRDRSIRIVAVEGDKVGGFQSFFYWPLSKNNVIIPAWQSGNSLVHPDFRGKGLFAKMLDHIHRPESGFDAEFLTGFPVEMSYNSFIRNKWNNLFNLQWYVKPASPLLSLMRYGSTVIHPDYENATHGDFSTDDEILRVSQTTDFDRYRSGYQSGDHGRLIISSHGLECRIDFKIQIRKKIIRELIVGKILFNSWNNPQRCLELFREAMKKLNVKHRPTLFSIACNPHYEALAQLIASTGFRKIDRSIYFITKGRNAAQFQDARQWDIQRADIDTW